MHSLLHDAEEQKQLLGSNLLKATLAKALTALVRIENAPLLFALDYSSQALITPTAVIEEGAPIIEQFGEISVFLGYRCEIHRKGRAIERNECVMLIVCAQRCGIATRAIPFHPERNPLILNEFFPIPNKHARENLDYTTSINDERDS